MDNHQLSSLYNQPGLHYDQIINQFKEQQIVQLTKLFTYITKEQQLDEIKIDSNIIGVDIEQTDDMGFDGRISLIQIKDKSHIYLIDVIEIDFESERLKQILKTIFEDQSIVKVFYAANTDVLWLKRDFGVVIQNLCDLKEIADKLSLKGGSSLVNLWAKYCDYHVSKHYKSSMQTSDWCKRPLSQEQLVYSALDCYYLPYLRYCLLCELSQKPQNDQLKVLQTLEKIRTKEYKKPILTEQQLILSARSQLKQILQESQELNNIPQIYIELITKQNAKSLVLFISSQILLARQQYALYYNDPPDSLDEIYEIVLIAIKIYEKLKIENIQQYEQFYIEDNKYENKQYQITLKQLNINQSNIENKEIFDLEWEDYLQLFIKGLYQSYQYDQQFIRYSLNQVYNAENQVNQSQEKHQQKLNEKKNKQIEFADKYTRQKPAYGSCKIFTKDDLLLCNCDEKKIRWYMKQDLATIISEDPLSIKLKFDPSGFKQQGSDKVEYITIERVNQCVICGADQHLLKYHIVPVIYKKHIQGKRSYDVVCLCMACHQKASTMNDQQKSVIAQKYGVPINDTKSQSILEKTKVFLKLIEGYSKKCKTYPQEAKDKQINQFRDKLNQLLENQIFNNHYGLITNQLQTNEQNQWEFDDQFIEQLLLIKNTLKEFEELAKNDTIDHGKQIIDKLKSEEEIDEFLIFWREQFLNQMKPQYLTEAWALDHKYKRTFGEKSVFKEGQQMEIEEQEIKE